MTFSVQPVEVGVFQEWCGIYLEEYATEAFSEGQAVLLEPGFRVSRVRVLPVSSFEGALNVLLGLEGGYVESDSTAGPANHGITQRTLRMLGENHGGEFIRAMPETFAVYFYHRHYWLRYHLGLIGDPELVTAVMVCLVNTAPSAVIRMLQRACNEYSIRSNLAVDGVIGLQTLTAMSETDGQYLRAQLKQRMWVRYRRLAAKWPDLYERYLDGWRSRLESI